MIVTLPYFLGFTLANQTITYFKIAHSLVHSCFPEISQPVDCNSNH